jgi:hypothetical protein
MSWKMFFRYCPVALAVILICEHTERYVFVQLARFEDTIIRFSRRCFELCCYSNSREVNCGYFDVTLNI